MGIRTKKNVRIKNNAVWGKIFIVVLCKIECLKYIVQGWVKSETLNKIVIYAHSV